MSYDVYHSTSHHYIRTELEKESLDVWVDGVKVETESVFDDEGTEIQFPICSRKEEEAILAHIRIVSSGNKREGIVYCLLLDGQEVPEAFT